jgi:hypothetical protein
MQKRAAKTHVQIGRVNGSLSRNFSSTKKVKLEQLKIKRRGHHHLPISANAASAANAARRCNKKRCLQVKARVLNRHFIRFMPLLQFYDFKVRSHTFSLGARFYSVCYLILGTEKRSRLS